MADVNDWQSLMAGGPALAKPRSVLAHRTLLRYGRWTDSVIGKTSAQFEIEASLGAGVMGSRRFAADAKV
jgi:hypothetical protein